MVAALIASPHLDSVTVRSPLSDWARARAGETALVAPARQNARNALDMTIPFLGPGFSYFNDCYAGKVVTVLDPKKKAAEHAIGAQLQSIPRPALWGGLL